MSYPFFAYLARMRLIQRWSLMQNNLPENVEEHSHRVALLAHILVTIGNVKDGKNLNAERAAFLGLLHDAGEVLTGDLPTPVKYFDDTIRQAYRSIENAASRRLLSFLPDEFRDYYGGALIHQDEDARLWRYVQAADKLSAWLKCVEERRVGNREFLPAERGIKEQLDSLGMFEITYFIEHFAPGFSMTLDELGQPDLSADVSDG